MRDLAEFDKIIAFPEGTTSHGIARRIYRDANKEPSIKCVEPGRELTLLTSSSKGTVALTPDLLGIDKLLADQADTYNVDLARGTTPEYNNVLVTALLSRADVVQEHPDLVRRVTHVFRAAVLPDQGKVNEAVRDDILPRLAVDDREQARCPSHVARWLQPGAIGLAGGSVAGAGLAAWLGAPLVALGIAVAALGGSFTCWLPMSLFQKVLHLAWLTAAIVIAIWWTCASTSGATLGIVLPVWLGVEFTILVANGPPRGGY